MAVAVLFLLYPDKDLWFHGRRHGHLINNTCKSGITTVSMLRTEQRAHLESRALESCSEESDDSPNWGDFYSHRHS